MKVRLLLALACALGTLVVSALAVEPVVLVATDKPEFKPVASASFLAWTVIGRHVMRAQATGDDTSFGVSPIIPTGAQASTGGIDGSTLIYDVYFLDRNADLGMYDLSTKTDLVVPHGVNTNRSEFSPSISGSKILFGRRNPNGTSVVLFDTATSELRVVYSKTFQTERRLYYLAHHCPQCALGAPATFHARGYACLGSRPRNNLGNER